MCRDFKSQNKGMFSVDEEQFKFLKRNESQVLFSHSTDFFYI